MKHGYREDSVFPKPIGNPTQINAHGQRVLHEILNHSEKKIVYNQLDRYGSIVDIYAPKIAGARFTINGNFIGFLET